MKSLFKHTLVALFALLLSACSSIKDEATLRSTHIDASHYPAYNANARVHIAYVATEISTHYNVQMAHYRLFSPWLERYAKKVANRFNHTLPQILEQKHLGIRRTLPNLSSLSKSERMELPAVFFPKIYAEFSETVRESEEEKPRLKLKLYADFSLIETPTNGIFWEKKSNLSEVVFELEGDVRREEIGPHLEEVYEKLGEEMIRALEKTPNWHLIMPIEEVRLLRSNAL
ncbi:MAG: hypothetical protein ACTTH5_05105 [Wolinella sp.]